MKTNFVGIDISLLSTGITCINPNGTSYANVINKRCLAPSKNKKLEDYEIYEKLKSIVGFSIHEFEFNKVSPKKVTEWDRNVMRCSASVSSLIYKAVNKLIDPNLDTVIFIENYSFGSKGNATIQIVSLTVHTKMILGGYELISGPEVKKRAGKGNFDKGKMLTAFLEDSDCDLKNMIVYNKELFVTAKGKVKKPIDDIVDSYWLAKLAKESLG